MKSKYFLSFAVLSLLVVLQAACQRQSTLGPTPAAPTPTPGSGPVTITIGTAGVSTTESVSGYIYNASSGGTNNGSTGLLTLSAHVGNTIILPGSSFHPLYFDNGSTTCLTVGGNLISGYSSAVTYTFPSTGGTATYYFHCGNHASGCSAGSGACGSTNCTAMAGVITVN